MKTLFKHLVVLFVTLCLVLLSVDKICAQKSKVSMRVLDKSSSTPIQYATILLTANEDSTLLFGGITDETGEVLIEKVAFGSYQLDVSFIGYKKFKQNNLSINSNQTELENVFLELNPENLEQVHVVGKKRSLYYKVDRKVINAEANPDAEKAIDLLENIPSLQVDVEGNLSYRGDGTFEVYINGHPVNNGTEKLKQLSSDKIDYIEVITNPSAKYSAEGTAGIIQVILKRNRLEGFVLSTSAKASTIGAYEWLFSVDEKWERGGWYLEGNLSNDITNKSKSTTQQFIYNPTGYSEMNSVVERKDRSKNTYVELGFNYDFTDKDYVDFMVNVHPLKYMDKNTRTGTFEEKQFVAGELESTEFFTLNSNYEMDYRYLGSVITYEHAFSKDRSHLLSAYVDVSTYLNPLNELHIDERNYTNYSERYSYNDKEYNDWLIDVNVSYTKPVFENASVEAGAELNINRLPKYTSTSGMLDENNNIEPFEWLPLNQEIDFMRDVYSGFVSFKGNWGKTEYLMGLRAEYTSRRMKYSYDEHARGSENKLAEKDFVDFFPSVHVVYNFSKEQQLTASYSRRINRPSYWNLVPIVRYESPYMVYTGNEELMPSYANAMELGFLKSWNDNFFSAEIFARNTQGLSQSYFRALPENNAILWSKENVGDSWSIGSELMTSLELFDWWKTNLSTSLYTYRLTVDVGDDKRKESQFRSDSGFKNSFYLGKTWLFKLDAMYRSPSVSAQMTRDDYWYSNAALRKTFNKRKWELLLAWSNVFNTRKYTTISKGTDFMVDTHVLKESYLSLKLSYRIDHQD